MSNLWGQAKRRISFTEWSMARIRAGAKSQTRRAVDPQPAPHEEIQWVTNIVGHHPRHPPTFKHPPTFALTLPWNHPQASTVRPIPSPYGEGPGELLWVREAWWDFGTFHGEGKARRWLGLPAGSPLVPVYGRAAPSEFPGPAGERWALEENQARQRTGQPFWRRRLEWYMPRHWSRMVVRSTERVRCERVQSLTWGDARAEGIEPGGSAMHMIELPTGLVVSTPIECYAALWDVLNGKKAPKGGKVGDLLWRANPWAWVLTFEVAASRFFN